MSLFKPFLLALGGASSPCHDLTVPSPHRTIQEFLRRETNAKTWSN
jgi:hypothetical protein